MTPCNTPCTSPRADYECFPTPSGNIDLTSVAVRRALTELEVIRKVIANLDRQESAAMYYQEKTEAHAYALCITALENLVRDMEGCNGDS